MNRFIVLKINKGIVMSEDTKNSKTPMIAGLIAVIVAVIAIGGYVTSTMTNKDEPTEALTSVDGAEKPTISPEEDVVIATVNSEEIKVSDAIKFVQSIPQLQGQPFEAVFPMVQEQLVSSRVVSNLADKSDVKNDPEVEKRLALAKTEIIRAVFVEKELEKAVTEASLQKAYKAFLEKQPDVEEARASHILVETEDDAKAIIKKLEAGGDFVALAKEKSTGPTGANGGDLGYFTERDMVPEFSKAAFGMDKGTFTKTPVKTQFGYHVIQLVDKRMRPAPAYDEVKPFLEAQERKSTLNNLLAEWKGDAKIEVFDLKGNEIEPASGE